MTLEELVDVGLARVLCSVYANTDLACRFVLAEIHAMATA